LFGDGTGGPDPAGGTLRSWLVAKLRLELRETSESEAAMAVEFAPMLEESVVDGLKAPASII